MPLFADRTMFCLYCGSTLAADGRLRCSDCGRIARMPPWFWLAIAAPGGVASGGWASLKDASAFEAVVTAVATAVLGVVALSVLQRHPGAVAPGRKVSGKGTLVVLALLEAFCMPAYWAVRADSDIDMTAGGTALITFVVVPALVLPLTRLAIRYRLGAGSQYPMCPSCGAAVSPRARFCGICGTEQ